MTHGTSTVPLAAIEALHATILMACALAEGGRRIDLMGLDDQAATLCTAVALLPRSEAKPLAPALVALVLDVERLAATLAAVARHEGWLVSDSKDVRSLACG